MYIKQKLKRVAAELLSLVVFAIAACVFFGVSLLIGQVYVWLEWCFPYEAFGYGLTTALVLALVVVFIYYEE